MMTVTLFAVLIASCAGTSDDDVPLIFAAASLSDVLTKSAQIYERDTGKRVDFSFGGSIALANQVAKLGAPADGVFFVGERPYEVMRNAGLISGNATGRWFTNSLVVVGAGDATRLESLDELAASEDSVAMGDPTLAPAGVYAVEALTAAGVWDKISKSAIYALDVRAAMTAVESGNAQFGIIYKTDAISSNSLSIVYEIDGGHRKIEYLPIALSGAANHSTAAAFLDFITLNPESRSLFESAGFKLVESG
jgi:molybdate transport system substrate-binding protein